MVDSSNLQVSCKESENNFEKYLIITWSFSPQKLGNLAAAFTKL